MRFGTVNFNSENREYTKIPNELFHNENLSHEAKFFLIFLLAYPEASDEGVDDLKIERHTGYDKLKMEELFKELEKEGYVKVIDVLDNNNVLTSYRVFSHMPLLATEEAA